MNTVPADSYLSFVLSRPLMEVWTIFLLSLGRVVPMIAITPFLGGRSLADPQKIGFGVAITFVFLPFLIVHTQSVPTHYDLFFILLLVKEIFIGALLGMILAAPYYFAQSAGTVLDQQRGAQSLQVQDPMTQTQSSPIGTVFGNLMLVTFFSVGGMIFFTDGVLLSLQLIPLDSFIPASFFSLDKPIWTLFLQLAHITLKMTIQLSAPALLTMLMADMFLGIANRMAPQVQITFLLYALKSFTGLGILALSWWILLRQLDIELLSWLKFFINLVKSFG